MLRHALPEVLAGHEALSRAVRWVHIVDVSAPDDLLRGGELVLSTGLGAGPTEAGQRRFVRSLASQQAAGLLIELGYSYGTHLPGALIAEAQARELPLIATHRPTRFVDITEAIHAALLDRRLGRLRHLQDTGERLTALVLQRAELGALLGELARALRNPVALENLAGQPVAFATYQAGERELLEAHQECRRLRRPGELAGAGWMAVEVSSAGHPWGQLTALQMDSPLHEEDRDLLGAGARAVELALLGAAHGERLQGHASGTFLAELMSGRLSDAAAARRAAALGLRPTPGRLLAGALHWRSERWGELGSSPEEAWAALLGPLRTAVGDRPALLGLHAGGVLALVRVGASEPSADQLDALAAQLRGPLRRRGLTETDVALVFAGSHSSFTGAGRRLERAAAAAAAARASAPAPWSDARRMSLAELLYGLRRSPELLTFISEQLGALFVQGDAHSQELLRTLESYLACSARKAQAARQLHLTRQSLYLRLERIERLLGVDLQDPDVTLALHLAIRAMRLTESLSPQERR